MQPLVLTASTAVSAMGRGKAATLAALRARRTGLRPCDWGGVETGYIGRVDGVEEHALPGALARFDCRNNRLADMALHTDGFADAVLAAKERYGAARVAVVERARHSNWPQCLRASDGSFYFSRSRFRTPASRVYSAAIMLSATSENSTSEVSRPARSTCRGSRWSRAMATFSSTV